MSGVRVVTNVGSGKQWTLMALSTRSVVADGEAVWSWRLDAGVKLATMLRIALMTVARKPITGESTEKTVRTIAQGRPEALYLW
jgi:hypothetical protein